MKLYELTLSPPEEAGSGGAASGGGGIPSAGPAPTNMPAQQPAGATPTAPPSTQTDILPEELWSKHVPYETADGPKTAPIREIAERLRRQNVSMNNILTEKKRLEMELDYLRQQQTQHAQQPPSPQPIQQPQPPPYPVADPYYDDPNKPIFDYLQKLQGTIEGLQQESMTRKQQEQFAAQQAEFQREVQYHTGLLRNEMLKYPALKTDPDAEVAILTEYNRLHDQNSVEYKYNPAAAAADAVRNYNARNQARIDAEAKARLEQIRVGLEQNKVAGVQGGGGMAPVPDPAQTKTKDWSSEGTKRYYEQRFAQAKAEGAFGKT